MRNTRFFDRITEYVTIYEVEFTINYAIDAERVYSLSMFILESRKINKIHEKDKIALILLFIHSFKKKKKKLAAIMEKPISNRTF